MNSYDPTRETTILKLTCKYGLLADLVCALTKAEMNDNQEGHLIKIKRTEATLEFFCYRALDNSEHTFYKYYDFARGLKKGLEYQL